MHVLLDSHKASGNRLANKSLLLACLQCFQQIISALDMYIILVILLSPGTFCTFELLQQTCQPWFDVFVSLSPGAATAATRELAFVQLDLGACPRIQSGCRRL